MPIPIFELIGIAGVAQILIAYFLLQTGKLSPKHLSYQLLNFIGAGLVLYSLCYRFNLSAFIVELSWLLISLFGILKILRKTPLTVPVQNVSDEK